MATANAGRVTLLVHRVPSPQSKPRPRPKRRIKSRLRNMRFIQFKEQNLMPQTFRYFLLIPCPQADADILEPYPFLYPLRGEIARYSPLDRNRSAPTEEVSIKLTPLVIEYYNDFHLEENWREAIHRKGCTKSEPTGI